MAVQFFGTKTYLALSITPTNTTSSRICAVNVKYQQIQFLLINVYMPNDDNSVSSYDTYGDICTAISSIICCYEHDNIWGVDYNEDFNRDNSKILIC